MKAQQELITAALTAADELDEIFGWMKATKSRTAADLREACARAMVQPAPDMAEVERRLCIHENVVRMHANGAEWDEAPSATRAALLDYVRGVLAERDALIADNERLSGLYEQAVKGRADMRSALREARAAAPQPAENSFEWFQLEIQRLQKHVAVTWPDWMKRTSGLSTATFPTVGAVEVPMPDVHDYGYHDSDNGWVETLACDESDVRTYGDAREAAGYAAEVPMPEADMRGPAGTGDYFNGYMPNTLRSYGDAREAAGYAAGVAAGGKDAERCDAIRHTLCLFRKAQIDLKVPTEKLMPEDIRDAVAWLVLHTEIVNGVCTHGVRAPHECEACADSVSDADVAAWMARAALRGEVKP